MATEASSTPLVRKLGIRAGARVVASGAPTSLPSLLGELPPGARLTSRAASRSDVILVFGTRVADLQARFERLVRALAVDGGLWLCYPKRASGVPTDLDFGIVQRLGLGAGLVDNKSAAIDETWSAVRFVVPLVARSSWGMTTAT